MAKLNKYCTECLPDGKIGCLCSISHGIDPLTCRKDLKLKSKTIVPPVSKEQHILVKYDYCCGEYNFCGHSVLTINPRQKPETKIDKYFKDFYGEGNLTSSKRCSYYEYNGGEVAIDDINWQKISDQDAEVLNRLHW